MTNEEFFKKVKGKELIWKEPGYEEREIIPVTLQGNSFTDTKERMWYIFNGFNFSLKGQWKIYYNWNKELESL